MNDVNFASKADDNTIYNSAESFDNIVMSLSSCHYKNQQKEYLSGFQITKWKEPSINVIWSRALTNSYKSQFEILQVREVVAKNCCD